MTTDRFKFKIQARFFIMLLLSTIILGLLKILGLLNLKLFQGAFRSANVNFILIAVTLVVMSLLGVVKYYYILKILSISSRFVNVLSTNLISQAIGQWMPGSMAVTEVIRFGLISGSGSSLKDNHPDAATAGLKGRIGLSIFLDRFIGLGVMFILSGSVALVLLIQKNPIVKLHALLAVLAFVSCILGFLFVLALLLPRTFFLRKVSRFLEKTMKWLSPEGVRPRSLKGSAFRVCGGILSIYETLKSASVRPDWLAGPCVLSLGIAVLNPLTLYLSALAVGRRLPLDIILVAVPFTILSIFLPLGLAGYGGPQVIAIGAFSLFHINPETVVAASLVQNTAILAVYTLCGGLSAGLMLERLQAILKNARIADENRRLR